MKDWRVWVSAVSFFFLPTLTGAGGHQVAKTETTLFKSTCTTAILFLNLEVFFASSVFFFLNNLF